MAVMPSILSTAPTPTQAFHGGRQQFLILRDTKTSQQQKRKKKPTTPSFIIQAAAAKLPPGVELPTVEPKFEAPFLGFTTTAEVWNSRVCMISLVGIFIIKLVRYFYPFLLVKQLGFLFGMIYMYQLVGGMGIWVIYRS